MSLILPYKSEFDNEAEEALYNYFKESMPQNSVIYFNYKVALSCADFILLWPPYGIFVIEVKAFNEKKFIKAQDNSRILYGKRREVHESPLKQADRYRFAMINKIRTELRQNYRVIPVVCYPYIGKTAFIESELFLISTAEETIIKEDLIFNSVFTKLEALSQMKAYTCLYTDPFSLEAATKVRTIFEGSESLEKFKFELEVKDEILGASIFNQPYSKLYIWNEITPARVTHILDEWIKGIKIYLLTNSSEGVLLLRNSIEILISKRVVAGERLKEKNDQFFNFQVHHAEFATPEIEIVNGKMSLEEREALQMFDLLCNFNLQQYKIEHEDTDLDIIVKAGAGTGKTYSMVSRIHFLIYQKKYEIEVFKDAIVMLTFTNDSAAEMKKRIKQHFVRMFLLTQNEYYFRLIESTEELWISTIHKYIKELLRRFAAVIGLGNESKIVSGDYDLKQIISTLLDQELTSKGLDLSKYNIRIFDLESAILDLLSRLKGKNIDLLSETIHYNLGSAQKFNQVYEVIKTVLIKADRFNREQNTDNNQITLNDLLITMNTVFAHPEAFHGINVGTIDYLFVDEFQDTDDYQIELIKEVHRIFKSHLFVVGDIKQCIYRFRGAEDKAFDILTRGAKTPFVEYSLQKNYRSNGSLIDWFNNTFVRWDAPINLLEYKSSDYLKSTTRSGHADSIQILMDQEIEESLVPLLKSLNEDNSINDIAILVRNNSQIEIIKDICSQAGMLIQTEVGGNLFQLISTIDLYKLLVALYDDQPHNLFNLYTTNYVKNYDLNDIKLTKMDFKMNFRQKRLSKWKEYQERLKVEPFMRVVLDIISDLKPWNTYAFQFEACEMLMRQNYYKRNLDKIIENILSNSNTDYLSLAKVINFLRIMILTNQSKGERELLVSGPKGSKISCLTIHKSKGLQYDAVILPFLSDKIIDQKKVGYIDVVVPHQDQIVREIGIQMKFKYSNTVVIQNQFYNGMQVDEQGSREREETRILYVAMTRAKEKLILYKKTNSSNQRTLSDLI